MTRDDRLYHLLQKRLREGLTPAEAEELKKCREATRADRDRKGQLYLNSSRALMALTALAITLAVAL